MPSFAASAPGKVILFGEHAVVYGRPAIAVPVTQVHAHAVVSPNIQGEPGEVLVDAPDIGLHDYVHNLPPETPLVKLVRLVLAEVGATRAPALTLRITSDIPIASGLGSGAAASVACIRALAGFLGRPLDDREVSQIAYEIEKIYHGTPSGVDNSVVTYARPVYYHRPNRLETFKVTAPIHMVIGCTGIQSTTAGVLAEVRKLWLSDQPKYDAIFDQIGRITDQARLAIEEGAITELGPMMDKNQELLQELTVSCEELDTLIAAARKAGALGAKLSGGGRGGNLIALIQLEDAARVEAALIAAGAQRTIVTSVLP